MRINCCRYLPILVFSGLLTAFQSAQAAPAQSATLEAVDPYSTYPQIVRLSYVEGDVRVSRGALADKDQSKDGSKATGWEQAEANIPIESGYSLVTGKGRAEIEFEDASTVYLADNSVLSFTELSTTGGVPYTEIALIAGTATMNVHTMVQGESFKQPDINWYFNVANTPPENRKKVLEMIAKAPGSVRELFKIGQEEGKIIWYWRRLTLVAGKI